VRSSDICEILGVEAGILSELALLLIISEPNVMCEKRLNAVGVGLFASSLSLTLASPGPAPALCASAVQIRSR